MNKNINGSVYTGNENKKLQKQNPNDFVVEKRGNVEINKGIMINNNDYNNDYNNNYNFNNNNNDLNVNYHNINIIKIKK